MKNKTIIYNNEYSKNSDTNDISIIKARMFAFLIAYVISICSLKLKEKVSKKDILIIKAALFSILTIYVFSTYKLKSN